MGLNITWQQRFEFTFLLLADLKVLKDKQSEKDATFCLASFRLCCVHLQWCFHATITWSFLWLFCVTSASASFWQLRPKRSPTKLEVNLPAKFMLIQTLYRILLELLALVYLDYCWTRLGFAISKSIRVLWVLETESYRNLFNLFKSSYELVFLSELIWTLKIHKKGPLYNLDTWYPVFVLNFCCLVLGIIFFYLGDYKVLDWAKPDDETADRLADSSDCTSSLSVSSPESTSQVFIENSKDHI